VRLRYAYWVKCEEVVKDDEGNVVELRCAYDPETRGGNNPPDGRKVKATLHWVSARHALDAEVRLYDRLFTREDMQNLPDDSTWQDFINVKSLEVIENAKVEPSLSAPEPFSHLQFERKGYFCVDPDTTADKPVFNLTVGLRDTWANIQKQKKKG
jgi:glutaminyl-tRNA synthetase